MKKGPGNRGPFLWALKIQRLPPPPRALQRFERLLGTSVKIIPGLKRGKIEIEYFGDEDLNRLYDLFSRIEK